MTIDWIAQATGAKIIQRYQQKFQGYTTDSRKPCHDMLFVALKGEQFDAHDFLEQALQQGAGALLVHRWSEALAQKYPQVSILLVEDTLKAFQQMGRQHRRDLQTRVIGITGSNGKTTTKEYIAAVLSTVQNVHWSKGSFNNHWGVPMTLLEMKPEHQTAVVEMGMNHAGEITELVKIAEPDIVLCTMVGRAHIENFGTIEKIALAKEEIYTAASAQTTRIYNLDNIYVRQMYDKAKTQFPQAKIMTFSSTQPADVEIKILEVRAGSLLLEGHIQQKYKKVEVPLFGTHNLTNLMAAACASVAAGLTAEQAWEGLSACQTAWGRNQFVQLKSGAELIFDGYNANPDSMQALLENVKCLKITGRLFGVFGQMRELGELSVQAHQELALQAAHLPFDEILFFGADEAAFRQGLEKAKYQKHFASAATFKPEFMQALESQLRPGDLVLVKASRGEKLERAVLELNPLNFTNK